MFSASSRGRSAAPISASTSSTAASISASSSSGAEASATCSDQVGLQRLLERGGERLDQLVGQLADEPDGVGEQVRAPADLERAGGRVERVEEAVAHPHLGAGERVEQRRLAGVGVAGERDRGQAPRARARGASRARRGLRVARGAGAARRCGRAPGGGRSRSATRPGPWCRCRRPCAPRRSRWVHSPRMRARLYSSCASSTCSLPSAELAWSAKMSRITAVRSITGTPSASSRLRSWRGSSSSSQATRLASASLIALLQLGELALAEVAVGVGLVAALGHLARHRDARGAQQLAQLGQVRLVGPRGDQQRALARACGCGSPSSCAVSCQARSR